MAERVPEMELIPCSGMMAMAVLLAKDLQGVLRCFMVWCEEDVLELSAAYEVVGELGGLLPWSHERRPLELGGDYPQLFEKLYAFSRSSAPHCHWAAPAMYITLRPTKSDDRCGMLGGALADGGFRLYLYFDIQSGLRLCDEFMAAIPPDADELAKHRRRIQESCLSLSGGASVLELDTGTAWFLCWLFQMHLRCAGSLP